MHGFESVVGPVKGVFDKETSLNKAREHSLLRSDRPAYVTILSLGKVMAKEVFLKKKKAPLTPPSNGFGNLHCKRKRWAGWDDIIEEEIRVMKC